MGLQKCDCRAAVNATGEFTRTIIGQTVSVEYTLAINICPMCKLEGSTVAATFSVNLADTLSPPSSIEAAFEGAPVGLPMCYDGVLQVAVAGTLVLNGAEREVTFTLRLNENENSVCILLPRSLPIVGDSICINVEDLDIHHCYMPR